MANGPRVLVTGSSGLVGSECVSLFSGMGSDVIGVDAHLRGDFFGMEADTSHTKEWLRNRGSKYKHIELDVRDREGVDQIVYDTGPDVVIHAAAQPSHDYAARLPLTDFDINAVGTLNLLEACRRHVPDAVFILVSTSKVYGDGPNLIKVKEREARWDYDDSRYTNGIGEEFPVDNCLHSLFGASKLSADVLAQEYGRYYGLKTGIFRAGCITGPQHAGAELHGFLSYLVKTAVDEQPYRILGYKGKQVRDQLHCYDAANAFWQFARNPKKGAVYNLGGGKRNSASVIECVEMIERICGKRPALEYQDEPRKGDHICYYTDTSKFQSHYPEWGVTMNLKVIVEEMIADVERRGGAV